MLELKNGIIYVKALKTPSAHILARHQFALEKAPINLNALLLRECTVHAGKHLREGRARI